MVEVSRLRPDRVPGSLDEARALVAYNERIIATSGSAQRRERAERMLANVSPHLARLEADEAARLHKIATSTPPARSFDGQLQRWRDAKADDDDMDVVWSGGEGLTSYRRR